MLVYSTILQGSEATEENAINFAQGFDFSEDETEEHSRPMNAIYINTVNGIDIYYSHVADYYFFAPEDTEEYNEAESDQRQFYPNEY